MKVSKKTPKTVKIRNIFHRVVSFFAKSAHPQSPDPDRTKNIIPHIVLENEAKSF